MLYDLMLLCNLLIKLLMMLFQYCIIFIFRMKRVKSRQNVASSTTVRSAEAESASAQSQSVFTTATSTIVTGKFSI